MVEIFCMTITTEHTDEWAATTDISYSVAYSFPEGGLMVQILYKTFSVE